MGDQLGRVAVWDIRSRHLPASEYMQAHTAPGMVPWKQHFLYPATASDKRLMSVQKCVRAGGKHNDLDNVGYTPRHHTFFEMLGFFSFGDLSKAEAIRMAWHFLTQTLKLPVHRLAVTVYEKDEESYALWRDAMQLPPHAITRHGDRDNFWSMGDEGPCGPCTEIFWDTQQMDKAPEDRWIEIWNIVFMEHNRTRAGQLVPLPVRCVDTGMGLERLASNKASNFDTDLFDPLKRALQPFMPSNKVHNEQQTASPLTDVYENIIVDHIRSSAFLVADGVTPSFHGAYPDLSARSAIIADVLREEEQIFRRSLDKGIRILDHVFGQAGYQATKMVPGEVAFQLYTAHGFPLDLTRQMAVERGWQLDEAGQCQDAACGACGVCSFTTTIAVECQRLMDEHRASGRASKEMFAGSQPSSQDVAGAASLQHVRFVGYDALASHATVVSASTASDDHPNRMSVAIDPCPFYGLGGGQASDTGYLRRMRNGERWKVLRVRQPKPNALLLDVERASPCESDQCEAIELGEQVEAVVDAERRRGCSDVDEQRLRFDFTHGQPLTAAEIVAIEAFVNEACLRNIEVTTKELPLADALASGAVANFAEKYAEHVRVVKVAEVSAELCGGTHVRETSAIYPFKIRSESSVAAVERVDALQRQLEQTKDTLQQAYRQLAQHTADHATLQCHHKGKRPFDHPPSAGRSARGDAAPSLESLSTRCTGCCACGAAARQNSHPARSPALSVASCGTATQSGTPATGR
ncbi:tRNA synthetases class II (A)-domain-containing protein [Syncephalis pseudoplumigaleata]|uniref:Alanine--tRNA ligase n=1 Tax=Syncephalis pseudoplumigaleata TaxID=1712513 RepID=A0A4P9YX46_9FUNG|nr:tRNA synthetases class II (A)-domain-containing protein [Syncephalis pseudoplumigaleata]|eukprot:RKP24468.1 tRNA synthetases class II (A)-domain-containing protein [Syncephalis pseudoplumigaleata]